MRNTERAEPARLHQGSRIAAIGLGAPRPARIHRREVGIGDDHVMAKTLQMSCDPLALGARLEEDACARTSAEHRGESLARCRDALLRNGPIIVANAKLTLALVQIEPYRNHGGWSPGVCLVTRR